MLCLSKELSSVQNTPLHLSVLGGSPSKRSTTRTALPQDSSISVVVPIQRRAGGSDAGDDPAEVYKYMLVDVTCQRYTVSTGTHFIFFMFFSWRKYLRQHFHRLFSIWGLFHAT
ncbi:hypothetical protein ZEAMMB73_Zm00001d008904 [Zea mays]|uniref:Uncharacterized protein n=1 Tax=Zea mays TaxID=4577 RepID=A0A1D6FGK9_MAIZE|nr:hypothetical protein ZEAMMB73_Zm00001d008904 [Zea mays]AQK90986.1 hypothetical protein ZEAMMB73_Zm00001d008904 [Zea mays]